MNFPEKIDRKSKDLIEQLLIKDPAQRIPEQEIIEHPFFRKIDWSKMERCRLKPPFVPRIESVADTSNFDFYEEVKDNSPVQDAYDVFPEF